MTDRELKHCDVANRFLIRCGDDTNAGIEMMTNYVKFIKEQGTLTNDLYIKELFNVREEIYGVDKQGCPVFYIRAGDICLDHMGDQSNQDRLVRHCLYIWELLLMQSEQHTSVCDLNGMSWGMSSPYVLGFFSKVTQTYEQYYPDIAKQILIINAPHIIAFVWPLLECMLSSSLRGRIHFLQDKHALAHYIDETQIATSYRE
jgi:hypothetical protein